MYVFFKPVSFISLLVISRMFFLFKAKRTLGSYRSSLLHPRSIIYCEKVTTMQNSLTNSVSLLTIEAKQGTAPPSPKTIPTAHEANMTVSVQSSKAEDLMMDDSPSDNISSAPPNDQTNPFTFTQEASGPVPSSKADDLMAEDQSQGTISFTNMATNQICKDEASRKPATKKTQKPYKYKTLGETLGFPVSKPPSSGWADATRKDRGSSVGNIEKATCNETKSTMNNTLDVPEDHEQLRADRQRIYEEV